MSTENIEKNQELTDILKGLNFSDEEISGIIQKSEEKGTDEYSEDKEKELEKAMNDAKEAYDTYTSGKNVPEPAPVPAPAAEQKEEKGGIDILKSMLSELLSKNNETVASEIQKSLEAVNAIKEEMAELKKSVTDQRPTPQASNISSNAILEKGMKEGVQGENGAVYMSPRIHKQNISDALEEIYSSSTGALQKSIEDDIMNFTAGNGSLSAVAINELKTRKNIIVR